MIHRYSAYIMKNLAWSTLLVALSLTSIIWLTQALRFVDFIVNRGLSLADFLTLTVLLIPSLLLVILPVSLFCAVLFVYNKLIADSELAVLASAGLGRWQLARPALAIGLAVAAFCYFISFYLLPISYTQFKDMQSFLRHNYASLLLQEEVFNSPVDGLTVFIRERDDEGRLRGILVHDSRNRAVPVTMMAEEGRLLRTAQGPRFVLYKGSRQENREGRLSVLNFDSYTVDIGFYTGGGGIRGRDEEEYSVPELLRATGTDEQVRKLRANAHHRLSWPIYALGLPLAGLAMLLTGQFNRRGVWRRIVASAGIALVVLSSAIGLISIVTRDPVFTPLMYLLSGGLAACGLYALLADGSLLPGKRAARGLLVESAP